MRPPSLAVSRLRPSTCCSASFARERGSRAGFLLGRTFPWKASARKSKGARCFREKVSTSVEIPVQCRNQARPAVRRRRSGPPPPQLHRHRASPARDPARRALGGGDHPHGKGDAAQHGARGHRRAAQREDDADAREGNAATGRVLAGPDRGGDEESARSARRAAHRARARPAGPLPPDEEQRRAHRRARRRQDRHRRGARAEDRRTATFRTSSPTSVCSRSTSRSSSRARSTAVSSKSASRRS